MISAVKELLKRPVAYHPILAKLTGSIPAAVMLSQGMYWQDKAEENNEEWFWVTGDGWFSQCGLTQSAQNTAREILRSTGFWFEKREGLPAKLFYRIDAETLISHIIAYLNGEKQVYRNTVNKATVVREASSGKFGKQVTGETGAQETNQRLSKSKKEKDMSAQTADGLPGKPSLDANPLEGEKDIPPAVPPHLVPKFKYDMPEKYLRFNDPPAIAALWKRWVDYRKARKKPIPTEDSAYTALKLLYTWTKGDVAACTLIVEKSIAGGWQSLVQPEQPKQPAPFQQQPYKLEPAPERKPIAAYTP